MEFFSKVSTLLTCINSFIHLFIHCSIHPSSFIHPSFHLFLHLFIPSVIHSCIRLCRCRKWSTSARCSTRPCWPWMCPTSLPASFSWWDWARRGRDVFKCNQSMFHETGCVPHLCLHPTPGGTEHVAVGMSSHVIIDHVSRNWMCPTSLPASFSWWDWALRGRDVFLFF